MGSRSGRSRGGWGSGATRCGGSSSRPSRRGIRGRRRVGARSAGHLESARSRAQRPSRVSRDGVHAGHAAREGLGRGRRPASEDRVLARAAGPGSARRLSEARRQRLPRAAGAAHQRVEHASIATMSGSSRAGAPRSRGFCGAPRVACGWSAGDGRDGRLAHPMTAAGRAAPRPDGGSSANVHPACRASMPPVRSRRVPMWRVPRVVP